jgi:hypothetical protein
MQFGLDRPKVFTLRLPPSVYRELGGLAVEISVSMNEIVACAVEKFVREAQGDPKAAVETVAAFRAARFTQEGLRLLETSPPAIGGADSSLVVRR